MMSIILLILGICGTGKAYEFPDSQMRIGDLTKEEIKVFTKEALLWIINIQNEFWKNGPRRLKYNETIHLPVVFTEDDLTLSGFRNIMSSYDMFFCDVKEITPYFLYRHNLIVVSKISKLHSLVHEIVHYVQKNYMGYDFDTVGAFGENLEGEAVRFQRLWEAKFRK